MDVIEIGDLRIDCIVGVLEREQRATQRVVVDLTLHVDLGPAGQAGDLTRSVDYALVAEQVALLAEHGRFRLIESLGLAACRALLATPAALEERAAIARVDVRIRKPEILGRCVPGVRMSREAGEPLPHRVDDGVTEEELVALPQGGAWRVQLAPGAIWQPGDRAALVLGGDLGVGRRIARGAPPEASATGAVLLAVGTRG